MILTPPKPATQPNRRSRSGADERPQTQSVRVLECVERTTRILIVEDEPLTAEVFARALARDGHEVEVASDGLQALNRLDQRVPTAVVLDMNLPTVSGPDVIRRLRKKGHTALPIIVVSGNSQAAANLSDSDLLPGDWIEKPVKPRDLVAIVRRHLPDDAAES